MKWDVFGKLEKHGGIEELNEYVHLLDDGEYICTNKSCLPKNSVSRTWSSSYLRETFDLECADPETILAVGELLCGTPLHGQWLGELMLHLTLLARKSA